VELVLYLSEAGVLLLDGDLRVLEGARYSSAEPLVAYRNLRAGQLIPEARELMEKAKARGAGILRVAEDALRGALVAEGWVVEFLSSAQQEALSSRKLQLMVDAGLAGTAGEALQVVRTVAMELAKEQLREAAGRPDLQLVQGIQAVDELDKTTNLLGARVREWYGLHFPELLALVEETKTLAQIIVEFKTRTAIQPEALQAWGLSAKRAEAVAQAAAESKGADLADADAARLTVLAQEVLHLVAVRDRLAAHVESGMKQIAPNMTNIAGATIGARLMAKAGGLQRLARLPASTIQVLGAEKALFRALRTGARPPKHGIIFQHQAVHSAPKWQRGKIARSLASKIALAARVDAFSGAPVTVIQAGFEKRLEEIRKKYAEPPVAKASPRPHLRKEGPRGRRRRSP
jgi:nucleolar protein 56